jgi:hypothetical protein
VPERPTPTKPPRPDDRLGRMRLRRLTELALASIVLAGCAGPLRTGPNAPQAACDAALLTGILARSGATGLGLQDPAGVVQPVVWPFGFRLGQDLTSAILLDATGREVAREGDYLEAGGSAGADGTFVICQSQPIKVEQPID